MLTTILRSYVSDQLAATGRRKHTQVALLSITLRFRTVTAFLGALGCKRIHFHVIHLDLASP